MAEGEYVCTECSRNITVGDPGVHIVSERGGVYHNRCVSGPFGILTLCCGPLRNATED